MSNKLTIQEFRELINKGEASDPLVFLDCIMNGQDPRRQSRVSKFIQGIDDFEELPTQAEWDKLKSLVNQHCRYAPVSLSDSQNAAKTVAEYLHSKRKSIENIDTSHLKMEYEPLTKSEIRAFLKIYESEF